MALEHFKHLADDVPLGHFKHLADGGVLWPGTMACSLNDVLNTMTYSLDDEHPTSMEDNKTSSSEE